MKIKDLGKILDERIKEADRASFKESGIGLSPKDIEVKIMGQISLLADENISSKIELEQTFDLDAHVNASYEITQILEALIKEEGMELDKFSNEIWMPPNTTWELCYEGEYVKIFKASPLDVLVSKAIKAPLKNKKLISESIKIYGNKLTDKILEHGGDIGFFK